MKVFYDTNVLIAASIGHHPHFGRADEVFRRSISGEDSAVIHAHSLLEFHAVVTRLPRGLAVPPEAAGTLVSEGILPHVRCVALDAKDVIAVQQRASRMGLLGGILYDFLLLAAAEREEVDRLYTFNTEHFRELASVGFQTRIVAP